MKKQNDNAPASSVLVIGLGLIGSSFALALKRASADRLIIGYDRQRATMKEAKALGVVDYCQPSLPEAVAQADVIFLSVPMLGMEPVFEQLAQCDLSGKVITDAGSCKGALVSAARSVFGEVPDNLVPGHPIAGSEQSGVKAGRADLFFAHHVILTPLRQTNPQAVTLVQQLWESCGAHVNFMGVDHHDQVLALTSHLPHFIAFSLMDSLVGDKESHDVFRYAAGGFRDFTRIAGSNPVMWHDVAISNKAAVLTSLDMFSAGLAELRSAIENSNSQTLLETFERARKGREHFASLLTRKHAMAGKKDELAVLVTRPGGVLAGEVRVPGDKSISHRAVMLGALAQGTTVVDGFLEGEDALATLAAFKALGVDIQGPEQGRVTIKGVGMRGLKKPEGSLYLGNAGTAMRLMAGLMAPQAFDVTLTGDESLSNRPMGRVTQPLADMGAMIATEDKGTPPLRITGGQSLKGIHYNLPMASAQVQSCLLLAGMYARGQTSVTTPGIVRDHTQRMLRGFGYQVDVDGQVVSLHGGGTLKATAIDVPADVSSAAFFMVAASIAEGSDITLTHVGINPTRAGVVDILRLMGADITLSDERLVGGEPVADIRVKSAPLKGIDIPHELVPVAIDEFPALLVAAACAEGKTVLTGAKELRVKESDRIQAMADGLRILGVDAEPLPDGMIVNGGNPIGGGTVDSFGDHRIAMAFAVAGLRATGGVRILDAENIGTSFPGFVALAAQVGMRIAEEG